VAGPIFQKVWNFNALAANITERFISMIDERLVATPYTQILPVKGKGLGVVACTAIGEGVAIEIAPALIVRGSMACQLLNETVLHQHIYDWTDEDGDAAAIGLGHTSMYNTDDNKDPNACFDIDMIENTIEIIALRDIKPGEEITISYRDEEDDTREKLVTICEDVAEFKFQVRDMKREDYPQFSRDVKKVQEALHQIAKKYFPKEKI
jgi:hypothetical protein